MRVRVGVWMDVWVCVCVGAGWSWVCRWAGERLWHFPVNDVTAEPTFGSTRMLVLHSTCVGFVHFRYQFIYTRVYSGFYRLYSIRKVYTPSATFIFSNLQFAQHGWWYV